MKYPVTVSRGSVGSPWTVKVEFRSPSDVVGRLTRAPNCRTYVARNWLIVEAFTVQVSLRFTLCWVQAKSRSTQGMLPPPVAELAVPDSGRALFEGKPMSGPGPERGVVFQNYSLLPWLSAYDNVRLAVDEVHAGWTAERRRRHIEACLEMVSLLNARDRKPSQLSGGMRQRVALARALALDPKVLLLDEPLSALDTGLRQRLATDLRAVLRHEGTTALMVTHDHEEAFTVADRLAVMRAGEIVQQGAIDEVWREGGKRKP